MKRVALISLVAGYLVLWPMLMQMATAQTSATMAYSLVNNSTVGLDQNGQFTVGVRINTGGNDSGAYDAGITYNTSQLSYVTATFNSLYPSNQTLVDDSVHNKLFLGASMNTITKTPVNNNSLATVATVTFEVINNTTSSTLGWTYTTSKPTADFTTVWNPTGSTELLGAAPAPVTLNFNAFVPSPVITSLTPNHGVAAGSNDVVIAGSNFGSSVGTVTFGTSTITPTSANWGTSSITVVAPQGTAGNVVTVRVNTNGGQQSGSVNYTYDSVTTVLAPDITGLNPTSGSTVGSETVVITGTNLGTAGTVTFGGVVVTPSGRTNTSMSVTSPARTTAGVVYIVVTNSATGLSSSSSDLQAQYTYIAPGSTAPSITNINPNQGSENGGTSVILTGSNFGSTEGTVYIAGTAVNAADVAWGSTSITFNTPAYLVSGNVAVDVSVTTNGGVASTNTVSFTYLDEDGGITVTPGDMNITYLSPHSGRADQTVSVIIYGSGFGSAQGTVRFGQYNATVTDWNDTQIRVNAPVLGSINSDITYPVVVTHSDGSTTSDYYTYLAPGSTGGGDPVTGGTTPDTGLPTVAWVGLITMNGGLALITKRKFFA